MFHGSREARCSTRAGFENQRHWQAQHRKNRPRRDEQQSERRHEAAQRCGGQDRSVAIIKFTGLMGQILRLRQLRLDPAPKVLDGGAGVRRAAGFERHHGQARRRGHGHQEHDLHLHAGPINNLFGPLTDFVKQNSPALTATIPTSKMFPARSPPGRALGKLIYDETLYNSALTTVTNLQDTAASARKCSPPPNRP